MGTGTICSLHRCGFRLLVLEHTTPLAIRRSVSLCEAVYDGTATVEGVTAERIADVSMKEDAWRRGMVPVLADPGGETIGTLEPDAVIDTILAKKNLGTEMSMAAFTIALGPGFEAGKDVHCVIETARGHDLGRIIYHGPTRPNSSIPGEIGGYTRERVVHAPESGALQVVRDIGSRVQRGDIIAHIGAVSVPAPINGFVRGMIRDGFTVRKGMKIGDIDPRTDQPENCTTISDKARCISGGVLEALLIHFSKAP